MAWFEQTSVADTDEARTHKKSTDAYKTKHGRLREEARRRTRVMRQVSEDNVGVGVRSNRMRKLGGAAFA